MATQVINGERVELTAQDEERLAVKYAAAQEDLPLKRWLAQMQASDKTMTRIEEDIIDALDDATKQRLNQEVVNKYAAKKALRGSKP